MHMVSSLRLLWVFGVTVQQEVDTGLVCKTIIVNYAILRLLTQLSFTLFFDRSAKIDLTVHLVR